MICKQLNLHSSHFTLLHTERKPEKLVFMLESRAKRCRCPCCHKYSYNIHSKYQRHFKDLPCFANKTHIQLIARKFYCRNPRCLQKIFTERFAPGIDPYKRMTGSLSLLLSALCLQSSCRSIERNCRLLHIQVSDTTLGRLLHLQSLPEAQNT